MPLSPRWKPVTQALKTGACDQALKVVEVFATQDSCLRERNMKTLLGSRSGKAFFPPRCFCPGFLCWAIPSLFLDTRSIIKHGLA